MRSMPEMEEMPTMMEMDDKKMPEMKGMMVGQKCKMMVDAELTSMRKGEDGKVRGSFKVNKVSSQKKQTQSYDREIVHKAMGK